MPGLEAAERDRAKRIVEAAANMRKARERTTEVLDEPTMRRVSELENDVAVLKHLLRGLIVAGRSG
jgi:hypothetical protein